MRARGRVHAYLFSVCLFASRRLRSTAFAAVAAEKKQRELAAAAPPTAAQPKRKPASLVQPVSGTPQ